jgi:hypothetical protein
MGDVVADGAAVAREFQVPADYRRCCGYLVIGGLLSLALAYYLPKPNAQPLDPAGVAAGIFLGGIAPALLWLYATTYRLMLDERGLSRRRLWWWTLWPWEAFIAGKITLDAGRGRLTWRERPLWDRWLMPVFLAPQHVEFLFETVRRVVPEKCVLKPSGVVLPPEEPGEVTLRMIFTQRLKIDRAGCHRLGRNGHTLAWNEITEFRIEQTRHNTSDLYRLAITSRDRRDSWVQIYSVSMQGITIRASAAGDDAWVKRLQLLVPAACWKYFRIQGDLQSREEGEFRLRHFRKRLKVIARFRLLGWGFLPFSAWVFVPKIIGAWNGPFLPLGWNLIAAGIGLTVMLQPTVMMLGLTWHLRHECEHQMRETCQSMAELAADEENPCHFAG